MNEWVPISKKLALELSNRKILLTYRFEADSKLQYPHILQKEDVEYIYEHRTIGYEKTVYAHCRYLTNLWRVFYVD